MNIYLTEKSEITNLVWAKAEHWWPRVIPYKLHYFILLGELATYICHKTEARKISIQCNYERVWLRSVSHFPFI
jgi:hypothetical protein